MGKHAQKSVRMKREHTHLIQKAAECPNISTRVVGFIFPDLCKSFVTKTLDIMNGT